jgi:hypothetical protein
MMQKASSVMQAPSDVMRKPSDVSIDNSFVK